MLEQSANKLGNNEENPNFKKNKQMNKPENQNDFQ